MQDKIISSTPTPCLVPIISAMPPAEDGSPMIWNWTSGAEVERVPVHSHTTCMFPRATCMFPRVFEWDLPLLYAGAEHAVNSYAMDYAFERQSPLASEAKKLSTVALSEDGKYLAFAAEGSSARVYGRDSWME